MANWYRNSILLEGDATRLAEFRQTYFKMNEDKDKVGRRHGDDLVFEFEGIVSWELKVDEVRTICSLISIVPLVDYESSYLFFKFTTPDEPPIDAIRKLLAKWPDLHLNVYKGYDVSNFDVYGVFTHVPEVTGEGPSYVVGLPVLESCTSDGDHTEV